MFFLQIDKSNIHVSSVNCPALQQFLACKITPSKHMKLLVIKDHTLLHSSQNKNIA